MSTKTKVDVLPGRLPLRRGYEARTHKVYQAGPLFALAVTVGRRWSYVELRDADGDRLRIVSALQGNTDSHIADAERQADTAAVTLAEATGPAALAFVNQMAEARQKRIEDIENDERPTEHHAEEAYVCSLERAALTKARSLIRRELPADPNAAAGAQGMLDDHL